MKKLKIITIQENNEFLRKISKKLSLKEIKKKEIQELIDQLIYTVKHTKLDNGWETAGLAAIQTGHDIALLVSKDLFTNEFLVYINPEIEYLGQAKDIKLEGCLSVPNTEGNVERFKRIRIKYLDRFGIEHKDKVDGYNARILQHETDHLSGILFIDKLV
ncbi:peptide deformylase [Candidatus Dojkabacteria bacterium]|jgi:peptide deformylase|nr:peptide deformylase [Candidatus Dojkabacteria bacterium]